MSTLSKQAVGKQGWLAAGMLFFFLSTSAWALDLNQAMALHESDSAQILQTLGHSPVLTHTSRAPIKKVRVVLYRSKKKIKYVRREQLSKPHHEQKIAADTTRENEG